MYILNFNDCQRDPPRVKFMTSIYHPGVDPKNGSADPSSFGLTVYTGKGTENNTIRNVLENAVIFFTAALYSKLKEKPGVRNKKAKEQLEHDARGFQETALRWTYQYAR